MRAGGRHVLFHKNVRQRDCLLYHEGVISMPCVFEGRSISTCRFFRSGGAKFSMSSTNFGVSVSPTDFP